jgi:hypothetical protein
MLRRQRPLLKLAASAYSANPVPTPKPLEQVIAEHKAAGEDVCENLTREFVANNFATMSYRIKKLGDEWATFSAAPLANLPSPAYGFVQLVGLCIIYWLSVMLGRSSIKPLKGPAN